MSEDAPAGDALSPERLRRAARESLGGGLAGLLVRQAWAELVLAVGKRVRFRRSENGEALRAYGAMTVAEFGGVNARQAWADWRVIPRSLRGRLPARACRAVDLCSGLGDSTQVLAYCLPAGSEILGLEYNPAFVRAAGRREYKRADGAEADVSFRAQSVLETFRGVDGEPLAAGSVDVVNSCGSLGIHFRPDEISALAGEIARVLRPGGLAAVDSGRAGVRRPLMTRLFEARGFRAVGTAKSCFLDRFTQIAFRKEAA